MSDEGLDVQVVAPLSLGRRLRGSRLKDQSAEAVERVRIIRPAFAAVPQSIFGLNRGTRHLNEWLLRHAVERGLAACPAPVTHVFAHFWTAGYAVRRWCRARGIPYFVELQESGIRGFLNPAGEPRELQVLLDAAGIVSVSRDNVRFLEETGVAVRTPVRYLPNGFDPRRFTPLDRQECRRRLGLPAEGAVVAFVGHFIDRKGPLRVLEALAMVEGARGVFIGRGPQVPAGPRVLHADPVLHSELPVWLSASDVFVLPSLAEGLANVTVEAMACGLPLVVSDRPFNRDFLTENEAVFVDPESALSIAEGLRAVLESKSRRQALGAAALARSRAFSLQERVRGIRDFVFGVPGGADRCA
jgi:glycosyltransferase involved in cell wall biosynthesis